ncbi:MAG: ABC transporter permease [Candidatus Heimdallarchaeota archaeon]|nr:ABC transporter permease [Candidatus Heimdallarchaeota archaeon]
MQRIEDTTKMTFAQRLDDYLVEHRLPKSMSWVGTLAVLWKHYFLNYITEFLVILIGIGVLIPAFGVSVEYVGIGSAQGWGMYFLFVTVLALIWTGFRFSWHYYRKSTAKKEVIIAKDGTLRERSPSQWSLVWRRYRRNKVALLSGALVIGITVLAIIYPILMPFSSVGVEPLFDAWNGGGSLANPNLKYPGGTDVLGRDEFSRLLAGSEVSLTVGVFSTVLSVLIGVTLGALAGYYRGWTEEIIMRLTDMFLALPFLVIAILAVSFIRRGRLEFLRQIPQSIVIIIVLGVFGWAGLCRLVSANTRQIYNLDYVNAARVLGASNRRIIMVHILPNILAPIIVIATIGVAGGILAEAGLTFLGLGSPTTISWGQMVNDAQTVLKTNPELALLPGFSIFFVVLAFNLLGDALRDALDPRLRE